MNTFDAIEARRSIRKFKSDPIPQDVIEKVLAAAVLAPSGKNKQPWRFVVVQGEKRAEMVSVLRKGIAVVKDQGESPGSSENSAKIMEQAPATIFIFNPYGIFPWQPHSTGQIFTELVDIQSTGAAIQNMILAAQDLGLGTLWICDVFYAYEELCDWLGQKIQMVAAVSLGYPDENPAPRPRKPAADITTWL